MRTLRGRVEVAKSRLAVMQPGSWRRPDATSTQRGYGYKWQQARPGYLAKHPFCVYCLRDLGLTGLPIEDVILQCAALDAAVPYASVLDHIVPHRGDQVLFWDRRNWQGLCTTHHSGEKQQAEAGVT